MEKKKKKIAPKPEAPLSSTLWGLSLGLRCASNHFVCVQKEEKREEEAENKFGKTLDSSSQTNVYMIYSFSLAGGRALVVNGWY